MPEHPTGTKILHRGGANCYPEAAGGHLGYLLNLLKDSGPDVCENQVVLFINYRGCPRLINVAETNGYNRRLLIKSQGVSESVLLVDLGPAIQS